MGCSGRNSGDLLLNGHVANTATMMFQKRGRDVLWVPNGVACRAPRILFVHGGSWMYGSPDTLGYGQLVSKLAYTTGALVMVPDFPLLSSNSTHPTGNFSTIMDALVAALQWLASDSLPECKGNNAARLFVAGDSSGGGSALSLVMMLRSRPHLLPGNTIAGAFFFSPWTNLKCDTSDYYYNSFSKVKVATASTKGGEHDTHAFADTTYVGDIIFQGSPDKNRREFVSVAEQYAGSTHSLTDPFKSPYHAGADELSGCPPLYFVAGGSETILGDSVAVAQRAAAFGVQVHLDIYPGMWHDFPMYSEGCGSGFKLWQAHAVLRTTGLFVKHISATGRSPFAVLDTRSPGSGSVPFTVINFSPETSRLMKGVDLQREITELFWDSRSLEDLGRLSGWAPFLLTSSFGGFTVLALQFVWRRLSWHKPRSQQQESARLCDGWMRGIELEKVELSL